MIRRILPSLRMLVVSLPMLFVCSTAWAAEGDGQDDLDKATEQKIGASTLADLGEVIKLCESALEKGLDQDNAEFARELLGATRIQRGMAITQQIFKGNPLDPRIPQMRKMALTDLEEGVKVSPQQPEALALIAKLNLLPGGDPERATQALDQAIALVEDRDKVELYLLRAKVEENFDKKLADLNAALKLAPNNAEALRLRGLVLADRGKLEESLADLDKVIELMPGSVNAYEAKALVLTKMKKYDDALICLDKAHELAPDSVLPLLQKVEILVEQENYDAAIHELNVAITMVPENVGVLLMRAAVYQAKGDKQQALADVDAVLKIKPGLPRALRTKAMLLADEKNYTGAIAELQKILKEEPKDPATLLQVAMLYGAEQKYAKAIEVYNQVLAEVPDNTTALRGRADSQLNLGKHAEAIADYDKILKLDPEDTGSLNNLAWVLCTSPDDKVRDGKRAITLATKASELTEYQKAHILSTLGAAYAETGDFDSAIKWVQKGIDVAGDEEREALGKELKSYQEKKPWRELIEQSEPTAPAEKQP